MKFPSPRQLRKAFPKLDNNSIDLMRRLARVVDSPDKLAETIEKVPDTAKYVHSLFSDPYDSSLWRRTVMLHAMNELMDTYGVEALGEVDMHHGPPYEYLNAGDTYSTTLIYDRDNDEIFIGSWGDVVERDPRLRDDSDEDEEEEEEDTDLW